MPPRRGPSCRGSYPRRIAYQYTSGVGGGWLRNEFAEIENRYVASAGVMVGWNFKQFFGKNSHYGNDLIFNYNLETSSDWRSRSPCSGSRTTSRLCGSWICGPTRSVPWSIRSWFSWTNWTLSSEFRLL